MTDFGLFAERTIKVSYDGEVYRTKLSIAAGATACQAFAAIRATVSRLVGIAEDLLWLKYEDEEGDLCTLTEISMEDLAALFPEGVLRLSLEVREKISGEQTNVVASSSSVPVEVQEPAQEAPSDSGSTQVDDSKSCEVLRSQIHKVWQKIPLGLSGFVSNIIQHIDPPMLHGLLQKVLEHKVADPEQYRSRFDIFGTEGQNCMDIFDEMLPEMLSMEPLALKSLLLDELMKISAAANVASTSSEQQQVDPLSAMLGAFLGGTPQQNPLIGAFLSGKGSGKGMAPPHSGESPPVVPGCSFQQTSEGSTCPQQNPFGQLIGALLSGKGAGKGMAPPHSGESPFMNPCAFRQDSDGNCGPIGNSPMENVLGALFAAKGAGKGFSSNGSDTPEANQITQTNPPTIEIQQSAQASNAARAVFEDSVEDLVNMGLVSDRQVARELLTKHGDISTVVSILTDSA